MKLTMNANFERDRKEPAPKLTIGMTTYDDYDGVYFSIQGIRLYHPEILPHCEILVIDNNPASPSAGRLRDLAALTGFRYVPYGQRASNAVKDVVFREARGRFVLCMDCHVLFPAGILRRLLTYLEEHPGTRDLLQGPLLGDGFEFLSSHMEPIWHKCAYGVWSTQERLDQNAAPFDIPMQGMGVFACARNAWPGINPRMSGFTLEEGYVHEKFRRAGGRTLCLPFFQWIHRFGPPASSWAKWVDIFRNYLLLAEEMGWDTEPFFQHVRSELGEAANTLIRATQRHVQHPFYFFEGVFCIVPVRRDVDAIRSQFLKVGYRGPVRRAPDWRAGIGEARHHGLTHVLICEDGAVDPSMVQSVKAVLPTLRGRGWSCLELSESVAAYHESSYYEEMLIEMPGDQVVEGDRDRLALTAG